MVNMKLPRTYRAVRFTEGGLVFEQYNSPRDRRLAVENDPKVFSMGHLQYESHMRGGPLVYHPRRDKPLKLDRS